MTCFYNFYYITKIIKVSNLCCFFNVHTQNSLLKTLLGAHTRGRINEENVETDKSSSCDGGVGGVCVDTALMEHTEMTTS